MKQPVNVSQKKRKILPYLLQVFREINQCCSFSVVISMLCRTSRTPLIINVLTFSSNGLKTVMFSAGYLAFTANVYLESM